MNFKLFSAILLFTINLVVANQKKDSATKSVDKSKQEAEQARLNLFFGKYCNETNEKILEKLEKCEDIQPQNMKQIELECVKTVLKKSTNPTYKEIKTVECSDELGPLFDDCESEKMKSLNMKADDPKLAEIAKKIMFCGFDCYGIKHE